MKSNILLKISLFFTAIVIFSCSKDNDSNSNSSLTKTEISTNAKIDALSNDVADIVDDQFFEQNPSGKSSATFASILPSCASKTTVLSPIVNPTTWTRTIDFGTTGCPMPNGAVLKGKIILSGSIVTNSSQYVISYTFDNFYHNEYLVQGNRTVTRSIQSTAYASAVHPVHVMDINMTITSPTGEVYSRVGTRTRECIEGFDTNLVWFDNVYVITGSWATTFPNGNVHANTISATNPIRIRMNCDYRIVRGTVNVVKNTHTAVLDYGDGTCDNIATIAIDGGAAVSYTFGN
jgi:hypothetical protein